MTSARLSLTRPSRNLPERPGFRYRLRHSAAAGLAALLLSSTATLADVPDVVASIKPVHSLVAGVMGDLGTPHLLMSGSESPHTYAMKPSDAEALNQADAVFWIGEELETFLTRAIANLGPDATSVQLIDAPGLVLLSYDEEDEDHEDHDHEGHDHGDHEDHHDEHADHDDHDAHDEDHAHDDHDGHDEHDEAHAHHDHDEDHEEHAHEAHDDHGHEHAHEKHDDHGDEHAHDDHEGHDDEHAHDDHSDEHAHDEHAHEGHDDDHEEHAHHDHDHSGVDAHIWLDPANARAMVAQIVETLSTLDPDNAATYSANGEALDKDLEALQASINEQLAPHRAVPYYTFHEALRYFDARFDLSSEGAITISPERQPGVQRLREIRAQLDGFDQVCVFAEPQFPPKLVNVVVEGTDARTGTVDPLGAGVDAGPEQYGDMLQAIADAFADCMKPSS